MRVALLHLDLAAGPQAENIRKIAAALVKAAALGARWAFTPETALQGYFFAADGAKPEVPVQPEAALAPIFALLGMTGVTLFLGCAERDAATGAAYNGVLALAPGGGIVGRSRKRVVHGSAEAWSVAAAEQTPIACDGVNVGMMVCADAWYPENSAALRAAGADVLALAAAWPPGPNGPDGSWERASAATGLPLWVCNQTGRHRMDMTAAESAVIVGGERLFTYSGEAPAVVLFDWDPAGGTHTGFLSLPA